MSEFVSINVGRKVLDAINEGILRQVEHLVHCHLSTTQFTVKVGRYDIEFVHDFIVFF